MTDPLDAQERARLFTARWAMDPCERKPMSEDFAEQIRQAEQAAREKALEEAAQLLLDETDLEWLRLYAPVAIRALKEKP